VPACTHPIFNVLQDCCPHCSGDAYSVPVRLGYSNIYFVRLDAEVCSCCAMADMWWSYRCRYWH